MSAKLIHTSDLLLDTCYAALALAPDAARKRRERLREVLRRTADYARTAQADALLIAGGLFHGEWATRDTAAFARDVLAALAPLPVYITPGAPDPYGPASPYAQAWPENVTLFSQPDWRAVPVPGAPIVVHGRAHAPGQSPASCFSALSCPSDGKYHVALLHAAAATLPGRAADAAAFAPEVVQTPGLHYLALGGHHATLPLHGTAAVAAYYSGAPEPHNFDESGPHFILEVTLEEGRGSAPAVRVLPVASALSQFGSYALDCGKYYSMDQLLRALRGLAADPALETLVRVKLQGNVQPAVRDELPALYELAQDAFEYLEITQPPAPTEHLQELARQNTSLGIFVQRLLQAQADAPTQQRKAHLARALEVGVAAYRGLPEPVPHTEETV